MSCHIRDLSVLKKHNSIARLVWMTSLVAIFAFSLWSPTEANPSGQDQFTPSGLNNRVLIGNSGFKDYTARAREMVARGRVFLDPDRRDEEIDLNSPFEIAPDRQKCAGREKSGIVMIHGLSGSPMIWRDLAPRLAANCTLVRTLLLPGHGTRAADLMAVDHKHWLETARITVRQLRTRVENVYVAGFSMGAALGTILAYQGEPVAGLVLLAPAFRTRSSLLFLTLFAKHFVRWLDKDPVEEPGRYDALPMHAAAEYHQISETLDDLVDRSASLNIPVFMAISTDDSVIDTDHAVQRFLGEFTSPKSKLVLISSAADRTRLIGQAADARLSWLSSALPQQNILKFSHLAMPFSPNNSFYGGRGFRSCDDYAAGTPDFERCKSGSKVFYTNARDEDSNPAYVRLTFNPYFEMMSENIVAFLEAAGRTRSEKLR